MRLWQYAMAILGAIMAYTMAEAQIPCRYEVAQVFQGPDCGIFGPAPTSAWGMSPNGQYVCGVYRPCGGIYRSYYWSSATGMVTIPLPANATTMYANQVNDAGQVAGGCNGGTFGERGFIYNISTGQFQFVQNLVSGPCEIAAINNGGVACGRRTIAAQNITNAFIRAADGTVTDLGVINGPRSAATDIAEDSTVVGWTGSGSGTFPGDVGFIYERGRVTLLPPVAPGASSRPAAINNGHSIVGFGRIGTVTQYVTRAFVYSNGSMQLIEPLAGFRDSYAEGISDAGLVTGVCNIPFSGSGPNSLYLWQAGTTYPLAGKIDVPPGLIMENIQDIAANGLVLGNGAAEGTHSVGLILVPKEPSIGDVDQNCKTDIDDLVGVIVEWGKSKSPADLNSDAIVDMLDLMIVIDNWTVN